MAYTQITLADLQTALADRYEQVPYWSSEEARLALNEGLRLWNAGTGFWTLPFLGMTVPSDPYVATTGSMVQATRVTYNGVPLEKVTKADLDWTIPNWRGTTTATAGAPSQPVYWAPLSLSLLVLYPADADGFGALLVDGVRATPLLVNAGDYVNLGQEEHDVLLGYALHVLSFKVGGQTLVSTYPGWQAFLLAMGQRNRQLAASAFYRQVLGKLNPKGVPAPEWVHATGGAVELVLAQAGRMEGQG